MTKTGKIVQVSGPVIDVEFLPAVTKTEDGNEIVKKGLPQIKEALSVVVDGQRRIMEVAQHIGKDVVR